MLKRALPLALILSLPLWGQSSSQEGQTPQQEYFQEWLNRDNSSNNVTMNYSVTGGATLTYGVNFGDNYSPFSQGFETELDSSLDLTMVFSPDSFTNSQYGFNRRGIYTVVTLSDFGVRIAKDAGVDFWESYTVYDDEGNAYVPGYDDDVTLVNTNSDDEDYEYESTFFATGIAVTEPTVDAKIYFSPLFYAQISSKPELDYNYSTTLGSQGGWAGVGTETTGGFSVVYDTDDLTLSASVVSQYEMNYEDDDNTNFVQDDEMGVSLESIYELSDDYTLSAYATLINFFDKDNDEFYFMTDLDGSSINMIASSGLALNYTLYELLDFGISGDFAYVFDGTINRGDYTADTDSNDGVDDSVLGDPKDVEGFLYDLRLDIPLYQTHEGGIALSASTYGYTFADQIYTSYEMNSDIPLDLQLSMLFVNERWSVTGSILAANILNSNMDYEDWLREDFQSLGGTLGGSYTMGQTKSTTLTPGFSLTYSMGSLSSSGTTWTSYDSSDATSVEDWNDDILGAEIYLEIGFPQTLITLKYESVQLLGGQEDSTAGTKYQSFDGGIFSVTTKVSY